MPSNSPGIFSFGLVLAFGLMTMAAGHAWAGSIELTPRNTHITFSVRHLGVSHVEGEFHSFHGLVRYGAEATDVTADVEVDSASVDTGLAMRDRSLREAYMTVKLFPTVHFVASRLRIDAAGESLAAVLDLHGVRLPVVLAIESGTPGDASLPLVKRKHIVATTTLSREQFGIAGTGSFITMADDVRVRIEIDNPATGTPSP